MVELQENDIARVNKTHGPFSSGTLVRVLEVDKQNKVSTVKIVGHIDAIYAKNLKSHGIEADGVFMIPTTSLTRRRYQLG